MLDIGIMLGALGFLTAILSLVYSHQQASAARDQVKTAREQAVEALRAAELVANNAREQALEALRAAELLATSEVSARVREVRARNFRANPHLPPEVKTLIEAAGGPDAYSVLLDSLDISEEIYLLRKRGLVTDEHWRTWMHDQMVLIALAPSFELAFQRAVKRDMLSGEFVTAFSKVFRGGQVTDPIPR